VRRQDTTARARGMIVHEKSVQRAVRLFALSTLCLVACTGAHEVRPRVVDPVSVAPSPDTALQTALAKIAAESDGKVAVTVEHLGNGTRASVHGDVRLPMMSVFKLPLAIVALALVDDRSLRLDQAWTLEESELRTVSPIAEAWRAGTHTVTLETMIVRTLQDSDNTAGDKLVAVEGGGPAITARLRALGINGIDVAEQEIEIFARLWCPAAPRPSGGWTIPAIDACPKPTKEERLAAARHEIDASPNAATTDALVDMLATLDRAAIPSHRAWLRDTLAGTKTGRARLKGLLPEGTRVEHKTGTGPDFDGLNIATNDVGVLTLPDGGRVAIAVLTAGSQAELATREKLIATLARAAWDHFTQPGLPHP
jgi:beta-lactamase class A